MLRGTLGKFLLVIFFIENLASLLCSTPSKSSESSEGLDGHPDRSPISTGSNELLLARKLDL